MRKSSCRSRGFYRWRRGLQAEIDCAVFPTKLRVWLDAAFLGNRYKLSRPTSGTIREGAALFTCSWISGLHIYISRRSGFRDRAGGSRKSRAAIPTVSDVFCGPIRFAVGAESSVVRAALMFTIVLFAPLVARVLRR